MNRNTINYVEEILNLILKTKDLVNEEWDDAINIISQICKFDAFHFACYSEDDIYLINVEEYWDQLIDLDKIFFKKFYTTIIERILRQK